MSRPSETAASPGPPPPSDVHGVIHDIGYRHYFGPRLGRGSIRVSLFVETVQQIAGSIQVMVAGRHAASGGFRDIRRLMIDRPHQYWIRSDDDRALAAAIMADASASGVQLVTARDTPGGSTSAVPTTGIRDTDAALHVQATDFARFVRVLPQLASRHGIRLYEVSPADESLESVFSYLVAP